MAIREDKLVVVWDKNSLIKENIEFLRTPTKIVTFPLSNYIKDVIADLVDTYKAIPCAGIAANQLGYSNKIFVGMKHDREELVSQNPSTNIDEVAPQIDNCEIYINPQIDSVNKKSLQEGEEGCLSIPDLSLNITRFDKIKVRYYTEKGNVVKKSLAGFISRLFQHELDHLKGNLMFENAISDISLHSIKDENTKLKLDKLIELLGISN